MSSVYQFTYTTDSGTMLRKFEEFQAECLDLNRSRLGKYLNLKNETKIACDKILSVIIAPFKVLAEIADLFIGTLAGFGAFFPSDSRVKLGGHSVKMLTSFGQVFSRIYLLVLKIFNYEKANKFDSIETGTYVEKAFDLDGAFTEWLYGTLPPENKKIVHPTMQELDKQTAEAFGEQPSAGDEIVDGAKKPEKKETWRARAQMRIRYLVMIPAVIVTRIVDFSLGLVAAVFSIISFGKFVRLNKFAYKNLKVLAVFNDIFELARNFVWLDRNNSRVRAANEADNGGTLLRFISKKHHLAKSS
jgi:hypothetical protein